MEQGVLNLSIVHGLEKRNGKRLRQQGAQRLHKNIIVNSQ